MKEITEYSESVSEYELFSFFYDRVIHYEIVTFSALVKFAEPILRHPRTHPVILKVFELIKRLHWGFFCGISPVTHSRLWRELVLPDKRFPNAGDLKRTLSISNLYVAMLDIHGYTKFCQDSRKNLSMLHTLDRTINSEIARISTQCQAVSQRERGDEIVVVAASATDALTATLAIIDYFGKTTTVNDPLINTQRSGDAVILPVFKLSAGVTGGNTTSPLIITEQGSLSGFLLNTGARLQSRANELSPKESRVMITKQVQMNYLKENSSDPGPLFKSKAIYFLDTGIIEFKGVLLPTCEAVFRPEDQYKERFSKQLLRLLTSIKENLWEQKIYMDLMELLSQVARVMPDFQVIPPAPINGMQTITNVSFQQLCKIGARAYLLDEDYAHAVSLLHCFMDIMEMIPQFDRLILGYTRGITEKYDLLLKSFEVAIDKEIDEKAGQVFSGDQFKTYLAAKNGTSIYERLKLIGRKSPELTKKKALWYNLIKMNHDKMAMTLYSGKK
ncbi:MAG: hypothetical protein LBP81_09320 [Treponema sp.]|jgi:hypothetical protein|nr:hypothetical protein [Treponema sp.]